MKQQDVEKSNKIDNGLIMEKKFSHLDNKGNARIVDISKKKNHRDLQEQKQLFGCPKKFFQ